MGKRQEEIKRKRLVGVIIIELVIVVILLMAIGFGWFSNDDSSGNNTVQENNKTASEDATPSPSPTLTPTPTPVPTPTPDPIEEQRLKEEAERAKREEQAAAVLEEAGLLAAMYDYDEAITLIKSIEGYETLESLTSALADIEAQKAACVVWHDNTQISHLFVHSLIVDTKRAFGPGSSQPRGYNKYMTTVDEFNKMLEQMYERGYVLVSVHDIAERVVLEDGTEKLVKKDILLPEGKIPFVLSQDDVNYYQYMDGDGFADRLVIGEDGLPTCQYTDVDGNVMYGEYDVLPIVDRFIREHPDFSYRGAKGILAITGYEGALGYDTAWHMYDMSNAEDVARLKEQQEQATAVAEAIKADGWEFASHSYTHTSMTTNSIDKVIYDTDKWEKEVKLILGETDIYIYPFGADICDWRGYSGDKFDKLKSAGFWYFCNVDSSRYWIQIREQYFRMGRINADGERMYKNPEKLEYFFDVDYVFDKSRTTPVE